MDGFLFYISDSEVIPASWNQIFWLHYRVAANPVSPYLTKGVCITIEATTAVLAILRKFKMFFWDGILCAFISHGDL